MKKKLITLMAAIALIFSCSMTAFAQPETMSDGTRFDAEYYAQKNPDVAAAFGTDANALYLHYVQFGKAEGRSPVSGSDAPAVPKAGKCPYCDTKSVRPLSREFHYFVSYDWLGRPSATYTHAGMLVSQKNLEYVITSPTSMERIGTYGHFNGNPIDLPFDRNWISAFDGTGQLDTSPYGQTLINIPLGLYQRFDGQVYQFDSTIFHGYQSTNDYDYIDESYGIPYFYYDPRITDWMCVNNSKLPDDVVEALQKALNNRYQQDILWHTNPEFAVNSSYSHEYSEWYEIALERLYGLQ